MIPERLSLAGGLYTVRTQQTQESVLRVISIELQPLSLCTAQ